MQFARNMLEKSNIYKLIIDIILQDINANAARLFLTSHKRNLINK